MAEALGWPEEPLGLRRHPRPLPGSRRVGPPTGTRSGARSGSARPTPTSPPAGCRRSSPRPTPPTARPRACPLEDLAKPTTAGLRPQSRVRRRALRRHHPDVPQQLVSGPTSAATRSATCRPSRSRRSRSSTTTPATPTACRPGGRRAAAAPGAAGGDLPRGGHRSTRTTRSSCSTPMGRRRPGGRRQQVRRLRAGAGQPEQGAAPSASARQPATCRSATRSTAEQRRRPRPAPDAAGGARARPCSPACSTTGRTSASRRRVLLLIDVSGSMGDVADPETGATKLDLAKQATIDALDDFNDDDEVGLWVFTTDLRRRRGRSSPLVEPTADGRHPGEARRTASGTSFRSTAPRSTRPPGRPTSTSSTASTRPGSTRWCSSPTA